jgi:hypothetical protein
MSTAALYQTLRGVADLEKQAAGMFAGLVEQLADNRPVEPERVSGALRRANKSAPDLEHAVARELRRRELGEVVATRDSREAELRRITAEVERLGQERQAAMRRFDSQYAGLLNLHRNAVAAIAGVDRAEKELRDGDAA